MGRAPLDSMRQWFWTFTVLFLIWNPGCTCQGDQFSVENSDTENQTQETDTSDSTDTNNQQTTSTTSTTTTTSSSTSANLYQLPPLQARH